MTPKQKLIAKFRAERNKLVKVGMHPYVAGTKKGRDLSCMVEGIDWCIAQLEGSRTTGLLYDGKEAQ